MGFSILRLDQTHDLKGFNCGNKDLDSWLQNIARQHQKKNISNTFILAADESPTVVIGYYALAIRGLTPTADLPEHFQKALPFQVPAITLGRLAVSLSAQNQGHGQRLLLDAMIRVKTVSRQIGGSFLFVDAKDAVLVKYYARYGFVALPDNPLVLCMAVADMP